MIVFAWDGFPQYAARCVGAVVRATREDVRVVASRPTVPIQGMEHLCGCPVDWLEAAAPVALDPAQVSVLFVSGWASPRFNRLARDVRERGGRVVAMVDNNLELSFRELLKAVRFRLLLRRNYDGFFVPGQSAFRLLRMYGVPASKIFTGLYAADATLFHDGAPLMERPKAVVYVGQFVERKNVLRLCRAFHEANVKGDWTLDLYGSGPLRDVLVRTIKQLGDQTIHLHDFLQPEELAGKYRSARVFCLPSVAEHWGLVVHEAALSGCALVLSDRVGAAADLLTSDNGRSFDPLDEESAARALKAVMDLGADSWERAQKASVAMASAIGLNFFVDSVLHFRRG